MGLWVISVNMLFLFCERLLASRWDSKYENTCTKVPWVGIILIAVDWLISAITVLMEYAKILPSSYIIIGALAIEAIALIIFSVMPKLTFNKYIKGPSSTTFSLSQRFQMSENYKSSKMLFRIFWVLGGTSILAGVLYCIGTFVLHTFGGSQLQIIFGLCYVIQGIAYPLIIIFHEDKLKQSMFLILCFCSERLKRKHVSHMIP